MPTNCHPVLRACLTFILIAAALVAHAQTARAALCFVASKGYTVTITGFGTINGTSHDDIILGSALRDVINGNGGNDVVCAGERQRRHHLRGMETILPMVPLAMTPLRQGR